MRRLHKRRYKQCRLKVRVLIGKACLAFLRPSQGVDAARKRKQWAAISEHFWSGKQGGLATQGTSVCQTVLQAMRLGKHQC